MSRVRGKVEPQEEIEPDTVSFSGLTHAIACFAHD